MKSSVDKEEADLLAEIVAQPAKRAPMLRLAQLYDQSGRIADAECLFGGRLPKRLLSRTTGKDFIIVRSQEAIGLERLFEAEKTEESISVPINQDTYRNEMFHNTSVHCPAEFVDIAENAFFCFDGVNLMVADQEHACVREHSTVNAVLLSGRLLAGYETAPTLSGVTLSLAFRNTSNYYHWLNDHLPKFMRCRDAGYAVSSIDNILVQGPLKPFQRESLAMLGMSPEQIVELPPEGGLFRCEQLILPKIHNQMGKAQRASHLNWLSSTFRCIGIEGNLKLEKLFVVRKSRGFSNQSLVVECLKKLGYAAVNPEQMTFQEQIAMFTNAKVVVATHGAALASLVFCPAGVNVHEFYGEHVHPCFWRIAEARQLNYHNYNLSDITDEKMVTGNRDAHKRKHQNLSIDLERLISFLSPSER